MSRAQSAAAVVILLAVCWVIARKSYVAFKKERERLAFNKSESLKPFPHKFRQRPGQKYSILPSADVHLDPQMVKEILDERKEFLHDNETKAKRK